MCGSQPDLPPAKDPKAEREKVAAEATASANAQAADNRRNKRQQSLLSTGGAMGYSSPAVQSSVLAQGKTKMGGG